MKKMMIALAGIFSVLLLASCQKEVEIDGDVSLEKTQYEYETSVECTDATVASKGWDSTSEAYKWGTPKILKADKGSVSWDNDTNSNVKKYELKVNYNGDTKESEEKLRLDVDLIKCKDSWYLEDVLDANKVTMTGSPEDSAFTVKAENWINYDKKYNFTLNFTRK